MTKWLAMCCFTGASEAPHNNSSCGGKGATRMESPDGPMAVMFPHTEMLSEIHSGIQMGPSTEETHQRLQ